MFVREYVAACACDGAVVLDSVCVHGSGHVGRGFCCHSRKVRLNVFPILKVEIILTNKLESFAASLVLNVFNNVLAERWLKEEAITCCCLLFILSWSPHCT